MSNVASINSNHPLIGKWSASDGFSDVVISISVLGSKFSVAVTDEMDKEYAEVYETHYDGERLKFNVHWPSNGRFIKYTFLLTDKNIVDVSYNYSGQEAWIKT